MNSNTVLGKIMTLLSMNREEVFFTVAKLADGTLVESPTFDVGESVEVLSEDGTKTPAPDGEHLLELKDESGNINRIKIFTEGGIITERENVEVEAEEQDKEEKMADVETVKVEDLPEAGTAKSDSEQVALEVDEEVVDKDAEEITLEDAISKIEKMRERIEELAMKLQEIEIAIGEEEEEKMEEEVEDAEEEEMLESKRLDGAPMEPTKFSKQTKENNFKIPNAHNSVLKRLYK